MGKPKLKTHGPVTYAAVRSQITDPELISQRRGQIVAAAVELFSRNGYFKTTIQDIARKAGVSIGLIYQYVQDKEDVLYLSLLDVLDSYEREIPRALENVNDPLLRVYTAVYAYCRIVNKHRAELVLAYRSTKSLPKHRRSAIKEAELRTNQLIANCVQECVDNGIFTAINVDLAAYQLVMISHTWALKHWAFSERFTLDEYMQVSVRNIIKGILSAKGKRHFARCRGQLEQISLS